MSEPVDEISPEIGAITDIYLEVMDVLTKECKYDSVAIDHSIEVTSSAICEQIFGSEQLQDNEQLQAIIGAISQPVIGAFFIQLYRNCKIIIDQDKYPSTLGIPPISPQTPSLTSGSGASSSSSVHKVKTTSGSRCLGIKKDKQQCTLPPQVGSEYCHHHKGIATPSSFTSASPASTASASSDAPRSPGLCAGLTAKKQPCKNKVTSPETHCRLHK